MIGQFKDVNGHTVSVKKDAIHALHHELCCILVGGLWIKLNPNEFAGVMEFLMDDSGVEVLPPKEDEVPSYEITSGPAHTPPVGGPFGNARSTFPQGGHL